MVASQDYYMHLLQARQSTTGTAQRDVDKLIVDFLTKEADLVDFTPVPEEEPTKDAGVALLEEG